jgi:hypothetical protein
MLDKGHMEERNTEIRYVTTGWISGWGYGDRSALNTLQKVK